MRHARTKNLLGCPRHSRMPPSMRLAPVIETLSIRNFSRVEPCTALQRQCLAIPDAGGRVEATWRLELAPAEGSWTAPYDPRTVPCAHCAQDSFFLRVYFGRWPRTPSARSPVESGRGACVKSIPAGDRVWATHTVQYCSPSRTGEAAARSRDRPRCDWWARSRLPLADRSCRRSEGRALACGALGARALIGRLDLGARVSC